MEIRFEIDTGKLTVADMLLIEDVQDGKRPFHGMTSLLARNMADENGQALGEAEGTRILSGLTIAQFTEVSKQFAEAMQRKAIPPMKSGG